MFKQNNEQECTEILNFLRLLNLFIYYYLPGVASSVSTELLSMRILPSCEKPTAPLLN